MHGVGNGGRGRVQLFELESSLGRVFCLVFVGRMARRDQGTYQRGTHYGIANLGRFVALDATGDIVGTIVFWFLDTIGTTRLETIDWSLLIALSLVGTIVCPTLWYFGREVFTRNGLGTFASSA